MKSIRKKILLLICTFLLAGSGSHAQTSAATDSVVRTILTSENLTGTADKGTELILSGNLSAASSYFNTALKNDAGNSEAYFGRGVVNLIKNDTVNACRDWSAVLALGDTATYRLLESHCHSSMYIEDDIIPKSKYKQMFTMERKGNKALSNATKARTIVDEMPEFPGGEASLLKYLHDNVRYPTPAKAKNITGTVYINFVISSKGTVLFPYVVRGIGGGCDQEALRVVKKMPRWRPGRDKGKPVLVRYNIPVKFK